MPLPLSFTGFELESCFAKTANFPFDSLLLLLLLLLLLVGWLVGRLVGWLVCWLVCWFVVVVVCGVVGVLVCWFVGVLLCWCVGVLVCKSCTDCKNAGLHRIYNFLEFLLTLFS